MSNARLRSMIVSATLTTLVCQGCEGAQEPSTEPTAPVTVTEARVEFGQISQAAVDTGLSHAVSRLTVMYEEALTGSPALRGSIIWRFRVEPDGVVRMLLEGSAEFTGGDGVSIVEQFAAVTMGHKWQFPASPSASLIFAQFQFTP